MILLLLVACKPPETAPTELTELAAWLFQHQDEAELLPDGLAQLDAWLETHAGQQDGYTLAPLTEENVAEVEHADRDLAAALGAVAEAASPHPLDAHAAFVLLPDQSVVNPDDYDRFERTLLAGGDCFGPATCAELLTWNDVIKNAAFGVQIPYEYGKDYHRVAYPWGDGTRWAMVSRGSVPEESFGEDGENGILQSYTLDVFLERDDGIHRVQAQWSEMALVLDLPDDYLLQELVDGLQGVFKDTDAAIESLGL